MRTSDIKKFILKKAGKGDFYGYEVHRSLAEAGVNVGLGRLYAILSDMRKEGLLKDRWEKSSSGPKRRVYKTAKKGSVEREELLLDAIRTVHEFYVEYLENLSPEHDVFSSTGKIIVGKQPKTANIAYIAERYVGPVKKMINSLQKQMPTAKIYIIKSSSTLVDSELENILTMEGNFEDVPVKDGFFDLITVTGSFTKDNLGACIREWHRALKPKGTIAIATPTALIATFKDPLGIGEFVEMREHPPDTKNNADIDYIKDELGKAFGKISVQEVVHITVVRASKRE
ncbi:MAG: helix-turn-helix transcriptional regulator [Candidatus Thorarchaeota archaeon]|jgi:DNA-binding PadR family transcriptional regulator